MSHVTTLKGVVIRDVSAMQQAAKDLQRAGIKCELLRDARPRMYYSHQEVDHPFVLRLEDSKFDLAFSKQADGTFAPAFDEWAGYISNVIGATCPVPSSPEGRVQHQIGQFLQRYAINAAKNEAANQGYIVEGESQPDADGNIQLILAVNG